MLQYIDELRQHPFTLISLADREKFHTGMVAYVMQQLVERSHDSASELLKALWGTEDINIEFDGNARISIAVERRSIDLMVLVNKQVRLAAEFKLKTTLSSHQLESYRKKCPEAKFVVLGVFPEPTGFDDVCWRSFPDLILDFFDLPERVDEFDVLVSNDEAALIRLWRKYLRTLNNVSREFQSSGLGQLDRSSDIVSGLTDIKLKGLFESYRYRLIAEQLNLLDALTLQQFNSNGNEGLHFEFSAAFPSGLQWQAGALKLFSKDITYAKGKPTPQRDDFLKQLCIAFCKRSEIELPEKMSKPGQFRSFTVEKWNIFDDCGHRPKILSNHLQLLRGLIEELESSS